MIRGVVMKLKVTKKLSAVRDSVEKKQEVKKPEKKEKQDKFVDEYKPMFPPIRFLSREFLNSKGDTVKQYLELTVKRFDDDYALPFLWITMYQESPFYTGYLKGKTVYLPLDNFNDLFSNLDNLKKIAEEKELFGIYD